MIKIPDKKTFTRAEVLYLVEEAYLTASLELANNEGLTNEQYTERVLNAVSKVFELSIEQIKSKSKIKPIIDAKKIVYYLLYPRCGTYSQLGRMFNQNHATVLFHQKSYKPLYLYNPDFRYVAQKVDKLLRNE